MDLDGLKGNLQFLKLALGLRASLVRELAPCIGYSITLVLDARLTWEVAPSSPSFSLSAGDGFGKSRGDALEFVTGLARAVAESLGFGGSGYINVSNGVRRERY